MAEIAALAGIPAVVPVILTSAWTILKTTYDLYAKVDTHKKQIGILLDRSRDLIIHVAKHANQQSLSEAMDEAVGDLHKTFEKLKEVVEKMNRKGRLWILSHPNKIENRLSEVENRLADAFRIFNFTTQITLQEELRHARERDHIVASKLDELSSNDRRMDKKLDEVRLAVLKFAETSRSDDLHSQNMSNALQRIPNGGHDTYNTYRIIPAGDIFSLQQIATSSCTKWDEEESMHVEYQTGIHTAEIFGAGEAKVTVAHYYGEGAKKRCQEDLFQYSRNRILNSSHWQLFAVNTDIPALIFHHELLPASRLFRQGDFWMSLYIDVLLEQFSYTTGPRPSDSELWIDTKTNALCVGPATQTYFNWGTRDLFPFYDLKEDEVSLSRSVEMLTTPGACFSFLYQTSRTWKSFNKYLLSAAYPVQLSAEEHPSLEDPSMKWKLNTVYSSSYASIAELPVSENHFSPIAEIGTKELLYTFYLKDWQDCSRVFLGYPGLPRYQEGSWLPQASRIFSTLDVPPQDRAYYFIVSPYLRVWSPRGCSQMLQAHGLSKLYMWTLNTQPITDHSSFSISSLETWFQQNLYWSLDEKGEIPLSIDDDKYGLSSRFKVRAGFEFRSWPNAIYDAIEEWQVALGFDPKTSDFAQSLGYEELKILGNDNRFEEADNDSVPPSSCCTSNTESPRQSSEETIPSTESPQRSSEETIPATSPPQQSPDEPIPSSSPVLPTRRPLPPIPSTTFVPKKKAPPAPPKVQKSTPPPLVLPRPASTTRTPPPVPPRPASTTRTPPPIPPRPSRTVSSTD